MERQWTDPLRKSQKWGDEDFLASAIEYAVENVVEAMDDEDLEEIELRPFVYIRADGDMGLTRRELDSDPTSRLTTRSNVRVILMRVERRKRRLR